MLHDKSNRYINNYGLGNLKRYEKGTYILKINKDTFTFPFEVHNNVISITKIEMNRPFKRSKIELVITDAKGCSHTNQLIPKTKNISKCNFIQFCSSDITFNKNNAEIRIHGFKKNDELKIHFIKIATVQN